MGAARASSLLAGADVNQFRIATGTPSSGRSSAATAATGRCATSTPPACSPTRRSGRPEPDARFPAPGGCRAPRQCARRALPWCLRPPSATALATPTDQFVPDLTHAARPRVFDRWNVRLVVLLAARGVDPFAGARRPRAVARGQTAHRPGPAGSAHADARSAVDCTSRGHSYTPPLIRGAGTRRAPTSSSIRAFVVHPTAARGLRWRPDTRRRTLAQLPRTIESDKTQRRRVAMPSAGWGTTGRPPGGNGFGARGRPYRRAAFGRGQIAWRASLRGRAERTDRVADEPMRFAPLTTGASGRGHDG
jgi:hypothetical protein